MAEETITAQTPEIDPGMSVMPEGPGLMDVPTVIPELGLAAQALASQVSFAKKTWKDGSGGGTPVTAVELNRLEQGVADLTAAVNALRDSVSQEWWGTSVTFRLETAQTFAVVEIGVPNRQMTFPFMVWFSGESPTNTTLPSGCSVANDGRDITISYNTNACFVVRKYVG